MRPGYLDLELVDSVVTTPATPIAPVPIAWSFPVADLPHGVAASRRTDWQRWFAGALPERSWLSGLAVPTRSPLAVPFAIVAAVAVLAGVYSLSDNGVYRPPGASPARQVAGTPPDARPAAAKASGVEAIYQEIGVSRPPATLNDPTYAVAWDPVAMTATRAAAVPALAAFAVAGTHTHGSAQGATIPAFIPGSSTPVVAGTSQPSSDTPTVSVTPTASSTDVSMDPTPVTSSEPPIESPTPTDATPTTTDPTPVTSSEPPIESPTITPTPTP